MQPYATVAELADYLGEDAPSDAAVLLRDATRLINRLTMTARYATDTAGMPTDAGIRDAMRDAACELVRWWVETGDATGAQALYSSVGVPGVNLGRASNVGGPTEARIGPGVFDILGEAALIGRAPWLGY